MAKQTSCGFYFARIFAKRVEPENIRLSVSWESYPCARRALESTEMKNILRTKGTSSTPRTADLIGRFLHTLESASDTRASAEAVIETLKLDTLDWRFSNGLVAQLPKVKTDALGQSVLSAPSETVR